MSRGRLKILELIDDAEIGGGQRHVFLLAKGLKRQDIDVAVACAPSGFLVDELHKAGIPVFPLSLDNRLRPGQLFPLIRLIREGGFHIVHTHGGTAGLWGRLAASIAGAPVRIHTYHGIHSVNQKNFVRRWMLMSIERALLLLTSHIICVSQGDFRLGIRHRLLKKNRATVIPNGIEVKRFSSASGRKKVRTEFGAAGKDIMVGTIGRLHVQKGLAYLLEAAQLVLQQRQHIVFVLVGDGPQNELLRRKANELGIASSVKFAGARQDAPGLLAGFDIFALPSLWEGLPLVLMEASAAQKAIVATDVDGTREIIQHESNGLLVPAKNPGALAKAILRLVSDGTLRRKLGQKARQVATVRFDARDMVAQTMNLYIEMSKSHGIN